MLKRGISLTKQPNPVPRFSRFALFALAVSAVWWGCPPAVWAEVSFIGLGDLPGDVNNNNSVAGGVSANGLVVVGAGNGGPLENSNPGGEAFRWESGVFTPLGDLPGGEILTAVPSASRQTGRSWWAEAIRRWGMKHSAGNLV